MSVLINFRIDEKLKDNMEKVCKELGLTMSAAFNMFANDLVKNKNISFSLNKKLNSGINIKNLIKKLEKNDLDTFDYNDIESVENISSINEKFFVNKVGDIIMLVPKDNVWAGIKDSAGKMSNDFMVERIQNIDNKRDEL
ncbi:MAG: type II toxin-antitoxin system RelB/DinJ family antitoxin [Lachnospiraceae bacterium]|nr:type II toxin-antitoxin system RelB/DinJ family antitoxin [Lachnospiraceae bacterium]